MAFKPYLALLAAAVSALGCTGAPSRPATSPPASARASAKPPQPPSASVAPPSPAGAASGSRGVNLLRNPGFEEGREPWTRMGTENWGAFEIIGAPTHSGSGAAKLAVRAAAGESMPTSRVFGVVQEVKASELPGGFPETLSGWYRVERWAPHAPDVFVYLQAVVIVWGDPRTRKLVGTDDRIENYQIRFMLAGSSTAPFQLSNAHYDFLSREAPPTGEWVRFEIPVRKRFQELWGVVPDGYQFLRILYEARWDSRPATEAIDAVVVYDDLFFGYGRPEDAPATLPAGQAAPAPPRAP